jgi:hypothetical protein
MMEFGITKAKINGQKRKERTAEMKAIMQGRTVV